MGPVRKIGVIGAGAAGLVAARELLRTGLEVVVYERDAESVGGVWKLDEVTEKDELRGAELHSSMYRSLRTNLPRDLMAFRDFAFDEERDADGEWRRYPTWLSVLRYLQRFAEHFGLLPHVRFGSRVVSVERSEDGRSWLVRFVWPAPRATPAARPRPPLPLPRQHPQSRPAPCE